jgi:ADP-ribose pyrophosphatase YjhB (NUDIX family)
MAGAFWPTRRYAPAGWRPARTKPSVLHSASGEGSAPAYPASMPTPQFVLDLRARIGHDPLPLHGITAVVFDDADRVLLVRRADDGSWTLVTGCLEPGEQPAAGAVREIAEETGVLAKAERILSVSALPLMACPNGDQVHWLDIAFRCRALSGEARVNDDESIDVGWFALDELPDIQARQQTCIQNALDSDRAAKFELA